MKTNDEIKVMLAGLKENYRDWFGIIPDDAALTALMKQNLKDVVNKFIQTHVTAFDGRDTLGALSILSGAVKEVEHDDSEAGAPEAVETPVGRRRGRPRKTEGDVGLGQASEGSDSPS